MQDEMTMRERWIAALDMAPVDRLPFWPKLSDAFMKGQASPMNGWTVEAALKYVGADYLHGMGSCVKIGRNRCSAESMLEDGQFVLLHHTPWGTLRAASRFDAASGSGHPVEFPIKSAADIAAMTGWYRDMTAEVDPAQVESCRAWARNPSDVPMHAGIAPSPLMHFLQELAGIAEGQLMLLEHPDEVAELFEAMHDLMRRQFEIIAEYCLADFVLLVENTSTTLISPDQYRRLSRPHVAEYAEIMRRAGKRLVLHMCGHLKAILPDLAGLPVCGFEAFTSPTVGNTTLLDGRRECPDKCLIGGTNAALWLESADEIIAEMERHLDELPHHRGLVLSSAGMMPPACRIETLKRVIEWVKSYPVRV